MSTQSVIELNIDEAIDRMGDEEIYLEIAHCFAQTLETSLPSLHDAISDGDMETATRLAHSLKGNCATVGAENLRQQCLKLEHTCRDADADAARLIFDELLPQMQQLRIKLSGL